MDAACLAVEVEPGYPINVLGRVNRIIKDLHWELGFAYQENVPLRNALVNWIRWRDPEFLIRQAVAPRLEATPSLYVGNLTCEHDCAVLRGLGFVHVHLTDASHQYPPHCDYFIRPCDQQEHLKPCLEALNWCVKEKLHSLLPKTGPIRVTL